MKKTAKKTNYLSGSYRLYSFTNMYLSSIQKGIQTAHLVGNLSCNYPDNTMYLDWSNFDKTIIVLNGGNSKNIQSIYESIIKFVKAYNSSVENVCSVIPFDIFNEDTDSLNDATTACGVILPEVIWSGKSKHDVAFYKYISQFPLAV